MLAWLSEAYLLAGRLDEAGTHELYRAMDMTFWLPQVEAALAAEG